MHDGERGISALEEDINPIPFKRQKMDSENRSNESEYIIKNHPDECAQSKNSNI